MYNEFMKDDERLWQICFNSKSETGSRIDHHLKNVSAVTVEDAIQKLRAEFPQAKIRSVDHKGAIHIS